ncbi:MAG: phosphodiester glycosidase family protein [Bacillota bacterium]|nr:phosphodiester glycosidase family protein [Bacillota bacterium]
MKAFLKRVTVALLISTILLPVCAAADTAEAIWGVVSRTSSVILAGSTKLVKSTLTHSDSSKRQEEFAVSYMPGGDERPQVAYGYKLYGSSNIDTVKNFLTSNGKNVIAGMNADYFSTKTGLPLGPVITYGVIRSSDAGNAAIGFKSDGSAFIGTPELKTVMKTEDQTIEIDHINKLRQPYALYLLTPDFSTSTHNSTAGVDVVMTVNSGDLTVGGTVNATIDEITPYNSSIKIPDGKFILTIDDNGPAEKRAQLLALKPGQAVTISVTSDDERWNSAWQSVGGGEMLVKDGVAQSGFDNTYAPRTAIGIKESGEVILYGVDGRQSGYSDGYTLNQLAQRMVSLGCVNAINLDGGGSTAVSALYPGYTDTSILNSPSDGSLRKCANYIFIVNNAPKTGELTHLHLYPYDVIALSGARQHFAVKASDKGYNAVDAPDAFNFTCDEGLGSFGMDGTFTAGSPGEGTITAAIDNASGTAHVKVVDEVTQIKVYNEAKPDTPIGSLSLAVGESANLTAKSKVGIVSALSSDSSYKWVVEGNIGTIDSNGLFTASNADGATGRIRVSYGSAEVDIDVTVGHQPQLLSTFESPDSVIKSASTGETTFFDEKRLEYVRYGKGSGRIDFDFNKSQDAENCVAPVNAPISGSPSYIGMWVYGDGSNHMLSVKTTDASGNDSLIPVALLNDKGWSYSSFALPENTKTIKDIEIKRNTISDISNGCVWLDNIAAVYSADADVSPPSVNDLKVSSANDYVSITANVKDNNNCSVLSKNLTVKCENAEIQYDYDENSGALSIDLSASSNDRIVSIYAQDLYGNLVKKSVTIPAGIVSQAPKPFIDMNGHWAEEYVDYLYGKSVIKGEETEAGSIYRPDSKITRAEFAVIMSNYLGLDVTQYSSVNLPYVDLSSVPSWALPQVKALYGNGIFTGRGIEGGKIIFDPNSPITRAEAMTVIGRTQPRGYAENISFTDTDNIPKFALPFVRSLVGQGAVAGYPDGSIKPNESISRAEAAKILYNLY